MPSSWLLFLTALTATAVTGPAVGAAARAVAVVVLAVAGLRCYARWGLVLGGVALGLGAGLRQAAPPAPPSSARGESAAAWEVAERWDERSVRAWVRSAGEAPRPVRLSGLPEDLGPGARGYAVLRMQGLRGPRNPDDREPRRRARARRVTARARVVGDPWVLGVGATGRIERWRSSLSQRWQRVLPQASLPLWRALLLADRRELDPAAAGRLRRLGLAHLMALSGLHVGIVAGLLLIPLRRWGRRALPATLPALMLWAVVAGAGPSLLRAVAMLTWVAGAQRARRSADAHRGLAVVGLLDLGLHPHSLLGVGWWLSYAATAAILRLLPALGRWPRLAAGLAVSIAAQAATAPWALGVFGMLAPTAAAILLVLGPLFALLLALGVIVLGASLVLPLPSVVGRLLALSSHLFGAAVALVEGISPAPWGHPGIGGMAWAAALIAWGLLLPPWRSGARARWCLAAALVLGAHAGLLRPPLARWVTLDVGQGDAGVLRAGSDALVVDAGPVSSVWNAGERVVLPYLHRRNLESVGLALTHGHLDHTGGANVLLETGRVGRLYLALCDSQRSWVRPLRERARAEDVELIWLAAGDRVRQGQLLLRCLWPPADLDLDDANDRSLVLRVELQGGALLLTGDLERGAESRLLAGATLGPVEVLKVAHHGGDTGTDGPWLARLRPRWALLSCGTGNRYGHPAAALVARLRGRDVGILRTDRDGAIEIIWPAGEPSIPRVRTVAWGFLDGAQGRSYPPAVRRSRASRDIPRGPTPVRVSEQSGR